MESTFPTQNTITTITIRPSERSHPKTYRVQCTSAGHNSNVAIVLLTDQAAVTLQSVWHDTPNQKNLDHEIQTRRHLLPNRTEHTRKMDT
eukprot:scaffold35080_cov117-Cyclotella_meneghiniana.AAC.1